MPASSCTARYPRLFGSERSEEHTSELQSRLHLVCRLLLEKKKNTAHFLPTPTAALDSQIIGGAELNAASCPWPPIHLPDPSSFIFALALHAEHDESHCVHV